MDTEKKQELQLKVAFWLGFISGLAAFVFAIIGIGAFTTMAGAF